MGNTETMETNYSWTRERLGLETFADGSNYPDTREPTNMELLRLLDALHADFAGTKTREYDQALTDRWYAS